MFVSLIAYLLPALASIDASRSAVQVLIVVPTRELGLQVGRVAKRLAAASDASLDMASSSTLQQPSLKRKIMIMNVLQGSQNRRQRAWAWAEPPHVVIGTPQELCDMVQLGGIRRYNSVKFVVVDEVDACLLNNAGSITAKLSSSTLHQLLSKYLSPTFEDGSSSEGLVGPNKRSLRTSSSTSSRPLNLERQTIFASATIPQPRHFVKQCVQNQWTLQPPVHVSFRPGELLLPATLHHAHVVCASNGKKLPALKRILQKIVTAATAPVSKDEEVHDTLEEGASRSKKVLIFLDERRPVQEIAESLAASLDGSLVWKESYRGKEQRGIQILISTLRYEDSLSQRAAAMEVFRGEEALTMHEEGETPQDDSILRVLLSEGDLGARGLDIADISHVINFDLPANADTYAHRAGRTGRFQRSGNVLSIVTQEQEFVLQRIMNKLNLPSHCIGRQQPSNKREAHQA